MAFFVTEGILFEIKKGREDGRTKPTDFMGVVQPKACGKSAYTGYRKKCSEIWSEAFQQNKDAINSLYFHHSYAESDILMGQEYTRIALGKHYEILPHTIQTCHARVICFFNALMLPSKYALRGNHESSLIQFEQGIPQMIYDELLEITELPFKPTDKQIFLF